MDDTQRRAIAEHHAGDRRRPTSAAADHGRIDPGRGPGTPSTGATSHSREVLALVSEAIQRTYR